MAFDLNAGLEGKSVLLTGAAGGIGREIALAFDAVGARVAVVDLAQDGGRRDVAAMGKGRHIGIACDLRPVAGHAALVAAGRRGIRRHRRAGADGRRAGAAAERRSTSAKPTGTSSTTSISRRRSSWRRRPRA